MGGIEVVPFLFSVSEVYINNSILDIILLSLSININYVMISTLASLGHIALGFEQFIVTIHQEITNHKDQNNIDIKIIQWPKTIDCESIA